jgi:hypothetical protein
MAFARATPERTSRKLTPYTPVTVAIWIRPVNLYWLYPISNHGKPVANLLRTNSSPTHPHAAAIGHIAGISRMVIWTISANRSR